MRIAVVGAGVSGLVAAYLLSKEHEVVLYESEDRLGGHAHTHAITADGAPVAVDTGFMVYNPAQYPEFVGLLRELGVASAPTDMSFSVTIENHVSFSSRFLPLGLFADVRTFFSPTFWSFIISILRFHALGKRTLREGGHIDTPLGAFLKQHRLNGYLREWYLYPMLSSIWSASVSDIEHFPTRATLEFMDSHDLLNNLFRAQWRTIRGGSARYVEAMRAGLAEREVRLEVGTPVMSIERSAESVVVVSPNDRETFDQVVIATHADGALALLAEPTPAEREILSLFSYSSNTVLLHGDTSVLPRLPLARAAWNYCAPSNGSAPQEPVSVVYDMRLLQGTPKHSPVLVSLNGESRVNPDAVYARAHYRHPRYSLDSVAAQRRLGEIQGHNRTLFVGAHWGFGFHEDGVVSAVNAVGLWGVTPPWKRDLQRNSSPQR